MKAPRAVVYRALIDAGAIAHRKVPAGMRARVHNFEGREGGTFRTSLTYDARTGAGKTSALRTPTVAGIVKLVPDEQVVEVDEFETRDPALAGEMTIAITLRHADGGTEVIAWDDGLPRGAAIADNEAGWRMARG